MVRVQVLETEAYVRRSEELLTPEERDGVRVFLAESPETGDMIPGLSGLRKLRWTHERRGKGKRGGKRVIYFYAISHSVVALLYVYAKGEKEELTSADRKGLRQAIEQVKSALNAKGRDFTPRKRASR